VLWVLRVAALGGMLIGLSVFQAEYDFGVPQFRLVLQPMMIAAAQASPSSPPGSSAGGVPRRRGGLLPVAARGHQPHRRPGLGEPTRHCRSTSARPSSSSCSRSPACCATRSRSARSADCSIGTLGSATEAVWSYVAMPLPWTADMRVEGLLMTVPVAVAAGLCGALLALGVQGRLPPPRARPRHPRGEPARAGRGHRERPARDRARRRRGHRRVTPGREGLATAEVTWSRHGGGRPHLVHLTAWQGGGLVVDRSRDRPGTTAHTSRSPRRRRKTLPARARRPHRWRHPVFLPADAAIEAEEIPAQASSTRGFVPEITLLQRERDLDAPSWLWAASNAVVLVLSLGLILALAWGVGRLARRMPPGTFDDENPIAAQEQELPTRSGALRPGVA
jgi:hypothetical protein